MAVKAELKFEGLGEVRAQFRAMVQAAREGNQVMQFTREVRAKLIYDIERQAFKHRQLSESWKKTKAKRNLDPRILIATSEYINSIKAGPEGQRGKWAVYLKGKKMEERASYLEYGTRNMPARPHWRPTVWWARRQWSSVVKKFGEEVLNARP